MPIYYKIEDNGIQICAKINLTFFREVASVFFLFIMSYN